MSTRNIFKTLFRRYSTITNAESGVNHRIFLTKNAKKISYWHDIPYHHDNFTYNMVIEIPIHTRIKYEMCKDEEFNPIKADTKKNTEGIVEVRKYGIDPIFNYGFIPQTWENNKKKYRNTYIGDNDPLDVVEIGGQNNYMPGDVIKVRILGSFCLIDEGEVDWKIMVINEKHMENLSKLDFATQFKLIQTWFRTYKTYEGKKENEILDNNRYFNAGETKEIIEECHQEYLEKFNKF